MLLQLRLTIETKGLLTSNLDLDIKLLKPMLQNALSVQSGWYFEWFLACFCVVLAPDSICQGIIISIINQLNCGIDLDNVGIYMYWDYCKWVNIIFQKCSLCIALINQKKTDVSTTRSFRYYYGWAKLPINACRRKWSVINKTRLLVTLSYNF